MPIAVLVATHLAAFGLGLGTMWAVVRRKGPDLADPTHHHHASERGPMLKNRPSWPTTAGVIVLVVGLIVVGFGVQQAKFQADQDAFRECVSGWAEDTTDTLETRTQVTGRLGDAQSAREDAVDNIILVVIGLQATPPTATTREFATVLQAFAAARSRLNDAERRAAMTRADNPYPALRCES